MNTSPDGVTVSFKTEPEELFLAEKSGTKPNLLCLLDFDEWTLLKKHNPTKIIIQHQQEIFLRTLTNIHLEGEMLNTWVVTFSWTQERSTDHHQPIKVSTDPALTHTATLNENKSDPKDKLSPVLLPLSLILDLGRHNRGRSHADFIYALLSEHITQLHQLDKEDETLAETCQAVEEPSIDERFAAITISNGTLALLQSIAHGRTMNIVIRELYEAYPNKKTSTWRQRHD